MEDQGSLNVTMDSIQLEESVDGCENLLGVTVQCNLQWSKHVKSLASNLKLRLAGLEKLKHVLNKANRNMIVRGVFDSILCYCLPLFGGCNYLELNMLQTLQNRAARIVLKLPPWSNRKTMFAELKWLTVRQLIVYHTLILVFKVRKFGHPEYLSRQFNQQNYRGNIIVNNSRLGLYSQSFVPRGSKYWNMLPASLKSISQLSTFKKELRQWVLSNVGQFGQ